MRRTLPLLTGLLCALSPALHAAVTCRVRATPVRFGVYDPLSLSPTVSTGTVVTTCRLRGGLATQVTIVSSFTTGSSGSYLDRTMKRGASSLLYNLYLDPAYSEVAGNGTGGSATGTTTLNLTLLRATQRWRETIYGSMPASQDVAPGTYRDSIVVTINY